MKPKIIETPTYKIYTAYLFIDEIFNYSGPWRYTQKDIYHKPFFDEQSCIAKRNNVDNYYNKLADMISKQGIPMPICVSVNMPHPDNLSLTYPNSPICWLSGGDILYTFERAGFKMIRCIISDFGDNKQEKWTEIHNIENVRNDCFNEATRNFVQLTEYGVWYPDMDIPIDFIDNTEMNYFGATIEQPPIFRNIKTIEDKKVVLSIPSVIPENKNPNLLLRHEQQFESESEKQARLYANEKAIAKETRLQAKARVKASKTGQEYVLDSKHVTWWDEKPIFVFVPKVYKAKVIPPKPGETEAERIERDTKNMIALGQADRRSILERRKSIAAGLMKEEDFPLWEVKEEKVNDESPVFGPSGGLTQLTATRDTVNLEQTDYNVYYKEVDPKEIFNYVGPWSFTQPKIRKKNIHATEQEMVNARNEFDGFYDNLEKNIAEHGMLDPIVVNYHGGIGNFTMDLIPDDIKKVIQIKRINQDTGEEETVDEVIVIPPICMYMGGSRLWVAQKLGLNKIPCIISDFSKSTQNGTQLNNIHDIEIRFKNKPKFLRYTKLGIKYEPGVEE